MRIPKIVQFPPFVIHFYGWNENNNYYIIIIRLINIVSFGSNNVNLEINTHRPRGKGERSFDDKFKRPERSRYYYYCNCMIIYSTMTTQNTYNDIISEQTQYK